MSDPDPKKFAIALAGYHNWNTSGLAKLLVILLFARRERIVDGDRWASIGWWFDEPYLLDCGEVS